MKKPKEPKKGDDPGAENTARSGKRVPAIFYQTEAVANQFESGSRRCHIRMTGSESERTSRPRVRLAYWNANVSSPRPGSF